MSGFVYPVALVLSVVLFLYLAWAMFRPEKF